MKKLITLTNLTAGLTKSAITGEVRKVDADKKKQIESMAKNIAELHNAGVKKLLRKEWDTEMARKYRSIGRM
jgi:hypothetical protein